MSQINSKKVNFEHVILTTVYASERPSDSSSEHNIEPFFDPHIIYPTLKEINDFRSNCIYSDIKKESDKLIVSDLVFKKLFSSGTYIFQPNDVTKSNIARCLFYVNLMYFCVLEDKHNYIKDIIENWKKFFLDNVLIYREWCTRVSDNEHNHNKSIIFEYGVPNIFIGYYDYNGGKVTYISNDNLIDMIFFGKEHDNHFDNVNFVIDNKLRIWVNPSYVREYTLNIYISDLTKDKSDVKLHLTKYDFNNIHQIKNVLKLMDIPSEEYFKSIYEINKLMTYECFKYNFINEILKTCFIDHVNHESSSDFTIFVNVKNDQDFKDKILQKTSCTVSSVFRTSFIPSELSIRSIWNKRIYYGKGRQRLALPIYEPTSGKPVEFISTYTKYYLKLNIYDLENIESESGGSIDYYRKYIKYKRKYLNLKSKLN
jgi:endonuclease I